MLSVETINLLPIMQNHENNFENRILNFYWYIMLDGMYSN